MDSQRIRFWVAKLVLLQRAKVVLMLGYLACKAISGALMLEYCDLGGE